MPYLLLYLFIETLVSVAIASSIGGLLTFFEIIISAFVGFVIIATFNYSVRDSLEAVARGEMSQSEFQKMNLASIGGAILLIIPGFFTDIVGLLLQFKKIASIFATRILKLKNKDQNIQEEKFDPFTKKGEDDVIDVEVIDSSRSGK